MQRAVRNTISVVKLKTHALHMTHEAFAGDVASHLNQAEFQRTYHFRGRVFQEICC